MTRGHLQEDVGEEEDGGEGGCCAKDCDCRTGAVYPLIELVEQRPANDCAQEDSHYLQQTIIPLTQNRGWILAAKAESWQ